MTNIQLPSGLIDNDIELFSASGTMMGTYSGMIKPFLELPKDFIKALDQKMNTNPSTILALDLAGFKTNESKLEKFAECNYGDFDFTADYKDGNLSESEYHECGYRGNCPMEGIVCDFLKVNGTIITPFEITMIQLLSSEDIIPVMAEKMNISLNTFETKKQKLFEKLGALSRARLVAICYDLQILKVMPCS